MSIRFRFSIKERNRWISDFHKELKLVLECQSEIDISPRSITEDASCIEYKGICKNDVTIGNKSIHGTKVCFAIPNLREVQGYSIGMKYPTETNLQYENSRLILKDSKYEITIDAKLYFDQLRSDLQSSGGYYFLYDGELIKHDNLSISYADAKKIVRKLNLFLSFLNGNWVGPQFVRMIHDEDEIWVSHNISRVEQFQNTRSWVSRYNVDGLSSAFDQFSLLFDSEEAGEVLNSAITWYITANNQFLDVEGSLILAQGVIELLYNHIVVEARKIILSPDSSSITAANKIRLLTNQIHGFNEDSIIDLKELEQYILSKGSNRLFDGIVNIRNAMVHAEKSKRGETRKISIRVKRQALQVYLHIIELSILELLKFEGSYVNRTRVFQWQARENEFQMVRS